MIKSWDNAIFLYGYFLVSSFYFPLDFCSSLFVYANKGFSLESRSVNSG